MVQYEDSDDREYSAAAYTFLKFLWQQLKRLADLVDFTLVAADTQAEKDAIQRFGNKPNGRLSRFVGMSDASRKATITRWRAEVKPLVSQASEHPETFDPEAFDKELCAIFDTIRQEEQMAKPLQSGRRKAEKRNRPKTTDGICAEHRSL